MKRILYIIIAIWLTSILTLDAQVDTIITISGELGGSGGDFEFVKESGDIVRFPRLTYAGEILYYPPLVTTDSAPETTVSGTSVTVYANIVFNGWHDAVTGQGFQICPALDFSTGVQTVSVTPDNDYAFCEMPCNHNVYHYTFTGLSPGTTYYVRSYATNSSGTSYGAVVTVSTASYLPTVSTNVDGNNVTATLAIITSNVTSDGGSAVTARGVCWGTVAGPTLSGSHTEDGAGTGGFSSTLTGLTPNTTYYVRPYATNGVGTNYGNEITFTTPCWVVTVSISGETNICEGESTTLTASGASEYEWRTNATTTIGTGATLTVNTSGTYFAIGYDGYRCPGMDSKTVTVHAPQHGSVTVSVCPGDLPYSWHGTEYPNAGDYTYGHTDNYGCLQVDTLHLVLANCAVAPTVTTSGGVENVTTTTASVTCSVTSDGGAAVTERGIQISINPYFNNYTTHASGSGTGSYTVNLTGLAPYTTYYVRSYATNVAGTSYSTAVSFTTLGNAPTLGNSSVSNVTPTTATVNGEVVSENGPAVTVRGVRYGYSSNLDLPSVKTASISGGGTGSFSINLSNLTPHATYYYQTYATNAIGTTYSDVYSFMTGGNAPTLGSSSVTNIAPTTATVNGEVVSENEVPVTVRGVRYGYSSNLDLPSVKTASISGGGTGNFSVNLSNLTPHATYYYQTYATNAVGTTYSDVYSFMTSGNAPTLGSSSVSNIAPTTATVNGEVVSENEVPVTVRGVRYGYSSNLDLPSVKTASISGGGTGSFSINLSNLTPYSIYYYQTYATNAVGTTYSDVYSFTTPGNVPTLGNCTLTDITTTGATFNSEVISDNQVTVTTRGFQVSSTSNFYNYTTYSSGSGTGDFSKVVTTLSPHTTYYVRAYATNAVGTGYSSAVSFTTAGDVPTLGNCTLTDITTTGAKFSSEVISDNQVTVTTRGFQVSTYSNFYTYNTHSLGGGTGDFSTVVTTLSPHTTYYVRAYATNAVGTGYSSAVSFTTAGDVPTLGNCTLTDITTTGAKFSSEVISDNQVTVTTRGFQVSTYSNFYTYNTHSLGGGTGDFSTVVTTLSPQTSYYVRAYATNAVGTGYSSAVHFTTASTLPVATTVAASNRTSTSATLNGTISNPDNVTITAQGFQWKTTVNGTYTNVSATGSTMVYNLTSLTPNTSYTYRAFVTTAAGTTYGAEMTFTTLAPTQPTVTTSDATNITSISARLNGSISNPDNVTITAQGFQWKTTANGTYANVSATGSTMSYNLNNLTPNVSYTYRAFVTTASGTVYGTERTFTTMCVTPYFTLNGNGTICENTTEVLSVTGENTYVWSTGGTGQSITISEGGLYTVTATNNYGCEISSSVYVSQLAAPVLDIMGVSSLCQGSSTTLFAYSNASEYIWNTGENTQSVTVAPTTTTTYSVTATGANGCTSVAQHQIESLPVQHESVTVSECGSYTWHGQTYTESGDYTYPHTDINGCQQVDTLHLTITNCVTAPTSCTVPTTHPAQTGSTYQNNGFNGTNHGLETVNADGEITSVTDYDGNEYLVVQIGSQCWLAENMRCTHSPSTGTYIVNNQFTSGTSIAYTYTGKMARWYNNDSATYAPKHYGLLYNWNAAVDVYNTSYGELDINTDQNNAVSQTFIGSRQGICPRGWHVPSDDEWTSLTDYVSSQSSYRCGGYSINIGKALASTEYWHSYSGECYPGDQSQYANNATGFAALPAGNYGSYFSNFNSEGGLAYFWSSTQYSSYGAYLYFLNYNNAGVNRVNDTKTFGFSVRCLRDETNSTTQDPTVTTSPASNVTETTATLNGTITNPDNVEITAKGFEWKATVGGTYSAVNATGEAMTYNLAGLTPNTGYTYKAFITYGGNTVYGNEVTFTTPEHTTFTCGTSTVTDYEGNVYHTVSIGNQCWTKENMRCTISPKGHLTPGGDNSSSYVAYYYDITTSPIPLEERGYLYNWAGAMDTTATAEITESFNRRRGICPEGWHVPSDREWDLLVVYLSGQSQYWCGNNSNYVIKALASKDYWNSSTIACAVGNDTASNNATGFSALPVGCRETSFGYIGSDADFHSSTSSSGNYAYRWSLLANKAVMDRMSTFKSHGRSVRCVSDDSETPTAIYMNPTGNETLTTCNAVIYDDGGPMNNYGAYCNSTMVIYPENANQGVAITGTCDLNEDIYYQSHLYFYDGENTNAPLVAEFTHDADIAVAVSGPMTIRFTSSAYTAPGFVLNVSCTSCPPPANVQVSEVGENTATVSWKGNADQYTVYLSGDATGSYTTTDTFYTINGLDANSDYSVQVRSSCGEESSLLSPAVAFKTSCAAVTVTVDDPWTEDFESYTGSGEQPFHCWDRPVVDVSQGSPFVYCGYSGSCHSGANSAELKGSNNMLALPPFTNDIHELRLSFWATTYMTGYGTLEVGVMSDVTDPSTFEVVGTTPAPAPRGSSGSTGNGSFMGYYDFSNVTASSGRIALRYTSTMSNNSWNLDDFVVELIPGGTSVADPTVTTGTATNITETSATLNGSVSNPDNVAITAQGFEWKTSNVGTYTAVNATGETMSLSLTGLTANTSYTYRAFVTTGGGTSYGDEVTFTTTAAVVYECLPYPCSAPPASQIDDVVHQFDNTLYGTASIAYDNNNEPYISIYKGDTLDVQCGWLYKFQVEAGAIYEWNTDVSHALYESVYVNYPLRTKITLFYDDFQTPVVASQEAVNTDILGCAAAGLAWKANYTGTVGVMVTRGDEELDIEGSYCACNNDPLKLRYDKLKESPTNLYFVWGRYGTSDTVPCDDNVHYIYDSGLNSVLQNASGDYSNNENGYLVLYPENSNAKIKLWGDCKMKDGDTLFIYYGDISLNIQFTPDTVLVGQKQLGSEDSPLLITPTAGQPISFRMQTDWECTWSGVELQAKCCLKPGLPADLIGTMNSDTSFLLSWRSAECNEIVYDWNLYKADDSTLVISGSVVDTFVIVEDLNQNDCYYFTVSALSACSEEYAVDGNGNYVVYSDTFCGFHITHGQPCTVSTTHPAQTGTTYQGNGYQGADHGLETVNADGEITSVTDYDGNEYPVVQIGSQCWLAENMRCTHSPSTGTYIVNNQFSSGTSIAYTYTGKMARWYNNDSATYAPKQYGLLYNWNAAVDVYNTSYGELSVNTSSNNAVPQTFTGNRQGICPRGWHVPSDDEWTSLTDYVSSQSSYQCSGNSGNIGKALASIEYWSSYSGECYPGDQSQHANNATGFAALPVGYCGQAFIDDSYQTFFWASYDNSGYASSVANRGLGYDGVGFYRGGNVKYFSCSVRCLRDETVPEPEPSVTSSKPCTIPTTHPAQTAAQGYSASGTNHGLETVTSDGKINSVTDYDGNEYPVVQIGSQCWLAENMRCTHSPSTGTNLIPAASTGYTYTGKQARWYNNDSATYAPMNYGLLYNWNAAVDTFNTAYGETSVITSYINAVSVTFTGHRRGICPAGWHLPSDAEWTQLTNYVSNQSEYQCGGNSSYIAKALASTEGWNSYSSECYPGDQSVTANNATGFSAVPAGYCLGSSFNQAGINAGFWSATQDASGPNSAYYRYLRYNGATVTSNNYHKYYGYSVRCLRDSDGGGESSATLPTVTTSTVSSVTASTATCGGNVTATGGASVTARGICWSTSQNPTVSNSHTTDGSGTGSFISSITGLSAGTTYYVRAYATNSAGTAYGEQRSFTATTASAFTCGTTTATDYDGNSYNTVQIGSQCWMKENLRTTHYEDGTPIPAGGSNTSNTEPYYYDYTSSGINLADRGLLYNWAAAMHSAVSSSANPSGVQGICPMGWHLPSYPEWKQLTDYVSAQSQYVCGNNSTYIAKALASTTSWDSYSTSCVVGNNQSSNNATGFSAIPAGRCTSSFFNEGYIANFWTSSQENPYQALYADLAANHEYVGYGIVLKNYGFSIRCLRDADGSGSTIVVPTATTAAATNLTATSATLNGSISNPDNVTVTAQGFEWKATEGGTYAAVNATGETMTYSLTGLAANTSYTYRAFVTTANGTSYGEEVTFTTLSAGGTAVIDEKSCPEAQTVTDHEGNVYATVQIGNQCWMRDNLRTTTSPSTGTYLVPAANANYTNTGKQARWINNDSAMYAPMNYGLLYNWNAAVDTFNTAYGETSVNTSSSNAVLVTFNGHRRGICPAGWHLPSDAEWTQLTDYVSSQSEYTCSGNSSNIAKALASAEGWNTYLSNCVVGNDPSTNNATGFSTVPAGYCYGSSFYIAGGDARFWSSTLLDSGGAYYRFLAYYGADVYRSYGLKYDGYSVRCLRD